MTYAQLVDDIKKFSECDETSFVAKVDTFIQLAERDIYSVIQTPDARNKSATGNLGASVPTLVAPSDFRAVGDFTITVSGALVHLLPKDPSFIREAYPSGTGTTRYYAVLNQTISGGVEVTQFLFGPTPASGYAYDLLYFPRPPSITAGTTGNTWLTDNAENLLLYSALQHAALYLKNPQARVEFKAKGDEAMAGLLNNAMVQLKSDSYRNTETRIQ